MTISVLISMFDLSPISDMPLLFCPQDNLLRSKMSSGQSGENRGSIQHQEVGSRCWNS